VNDLAAAAFASQSGRHLVEPPRGGSFRAFLRGFDRAAYEAALAARGICFVARTHPEYPAGLRSIHDPPLGLFLRGAAGAAALARTAIAVVGARSCSAYGAQVARALGRDLAGAGLVVVSGLARGIDAEAHRGALEAGGTTLAVLGCGIDRDYPAANAALAAEIAATGLLVSEYGPGVEPAPWRFPARNRIIAGLAVATVVVEARERSGALITADLALEEGRDVYAVPGEITSALSTGTNRLLRLGAAPLLGAADVLDGLGLPIVPRAGPADLGEPGAHLLALIRDGPAGADELARRAGLDAPAVAVALSELELAGLVQAAAGVYRAA
jgi:DNA processing protein